MDQTRWKAVTEIFHAALELDPRDRSGYVSKASQGDEAIEAEVNRLLRADSEATDFLEEPLTQFASLEQFTPSESLFTSGDILKDRYKILRLVGQGGMGYVLEAVDLELNVRIAVKAIRPEIAIHSPMLELLRREVRIARSITHRNVCRTYDLDKGSLTSGAQQGDFFFLTMEFLAGETLAERLRRTGPLPIPEALDVARQVADGLDCSHAAGVIHRDIKPGNIMLVSDQAGASRAVIMDFGLARLDPRHRLSQASPSLSGLAGTLAYMAPEQIHPQGVVSPATDVYAFGLLLREAVTGHLVPDSFMVESNRPPSDDQARGSEIFSSTLPDRWDRVILGCLEVEPSKRFQSAGDVVRALEGALILRPKLPPESSGDANHLVRRGLRRLTWTGCTVLLAMSLFWAWLRFHNQELESQIGPGTVVYLTPLKNETGLQELNGIGELLRTSLSQSSQFNLLAQGRIGDTLQMMSKSPETGITDPIAREIAMRTGAARVMFATVTGSSGTYRLNIEIEQPDNTPSRYRKRWVRSFEWSSTPANANTNSKGAIPAELLGAVRDASDWTRQKVGESRDDIARLNAPLEDVTTSNWEALDEYSNAMNAQQNRQTEDAIRFLNRAIDIDPAFALAYARLGDLENDLDRFKDGIDAYQKSLIVSADKRLTRRERDRIRGLFAMDTGDFQTAEDAFRDYTLFYSNDFRGYFYQGYPLMMLGRFDESATTLRRSIQLDDSEFSPQIQLACLYIVLGDLPKAQDLARHQLVKGRDADANKILGEIAFLQSDFQASERYFESMKTSSDPFASLMSLSLLARLSAERGQYDRSLDYLEETIEIAREQGDQIEMASGLLDRAYIHSELGDYKEAFEETRSALALDRSLQRIAFASSVLSSGILHTSGPLAAAMRKELVDLDDGVRSNDAIVLSKVVKHRIHGELLMADRRWKPAVQSMRMAAALDAPINPKEYLARALASAAVHESDAAAAQAFHKAAIDTYETSTQSPGVIWSIARQYPPGYLADQMTALFGLSGQSSQGNERLIPQWHRLSALRGSSIPRRP